MTDKVKLLLNDLNSKKYQTLRKPCDVIPETFEERIAKDIPLLYENDDFGFNRGIALKLKGGVGNVTPNYYAVLNKGFDLIIKNIKTAIENEVDNEKIEYGETTINKLNVCLKRCDEYCEYAKNKGNIKLHNALKNIPRKPANNLYEALVFIKLCIYFLRLHSFDHLGFGRFDKELYPFYLKEKENGVSDEEILSLIEEFFISINRDIDLYAGVQMGDNGQSIIFGGVDENGNYEYNELSDICLDASYNLSLIEPKINLRVNKNTPLKLYEKATLLTKRGLGFPQYCNDDVVVKGLTKLGYDIKDAVNYSVAACWEFLVPGKSAEILNTGKFNFPLIVNETVHKHLQTEDTFNGFMLKVKDAIKCECERIRKEKEGLRINSCHLLSVFIDDCAENLQDMWCGGAKYKNFGCHGIGIANATDALAAIKHRVYEEKSISKNRLIEALNANFEGYDYERNLLLSSPKMGNNDNYADSLSIEIMEAFAKNMNNKKNPWGGVWRAGTGSAHEYYYSAKRCPATCDGRKAYDYYSSSFSPSLGVKTEGILSVIKSFTKYDLSNVINGGPLTIEVHDSTLRNEDGSKKMAMLVKYFIDNGGHQLQLNSVNKEMLKDAQLHPEKFPNLIVRVWGWSGYFVELDKLYQDHIISRLEYT